MAHKGVAGISLCTSNPSEVILEGVALYSREVLHRWDTFDLIVCASKANGYLISGNTDKGTVLFDLSVPRNVDPNIGAKVYNIDQLISNKGEEPVLEQCEALIWDNIHRLSQIYRLKSNCSVCSSAYVN